MTVQGVRYVSLAGLGGYSTAAERAMLGLLDAGVPVTWTPIDWSAGGVPVAAPDSAPAALRAIAGADIAHDVAVLHSVPEMLPAWRARLDVPIVCSTAWETTRLPGHWPALLGTADRIVVPCRMNRDVVEAAGVSTPVAVVPHLPPTPLDGVEPRPIDPRLGDDDAFVLLTVGDWTRRKAIDLTITSYLRAFGPDDGVVLVVKTSPEDRTARGPAGGGALHGSTTWAVTRLLADHAGPGGRTAPVLLVTGSMSPVEMRQLQRRSDGYVSLTRGEGFCLPSFDAAATGRPVVITGFGGHLDFLDPHDAHLVSHDLVAVDSVPGSRSYTADQRWAEPSVDHASSLLRAVVGDRAGSLERGARLQRRIASDFSAGSGTRRLLEVLDSARAGAGGSGGDAPVGSAVPRAPA